MKTVAIIGTFDTKGEEFAYVKARFEELGINTLTIHCGVFDPQTMPDVPNTEVAAAGGGRPAIAALVAPPAPPPTTRDNDLVTYREILAFMNGEANIERDPRALPRRAWPTKHRLAYDLLTFIAAAAIGCALVALLYLLPSVLG